MSHPVLDDFDDDMCPNCVTPWKCNGPHLTGERNYEQGEYDGRIAAMKMAEIEAFAAIRRAAEVAREWDCIYGDGFIDMEEHEVIPAQIRRAIRAAIGSEKA